MNKHDMKSFAHRVLLLGVLLVSLLAAAGARAQLGDLMEQGKRAVSPGGSQEAAGGLGGALSGQSLSSGSVGNVAGVLEFCIRNNYLGGDGPASVKEKLMGKLPGGSSTSDKGYQSGAKGLLTGSNGQQLDLSGGGLKAEATKRVCDTILAQGKSML